MNKKDFQSGIAQLCLISAIVICVATCAFSQPRTGSVVNPGIFATVPETAPKKVGKWHWNNAYYFKSPQYLAKPRKALDWSDFTETWDGKQVSFFCLYAISGIAHGAGEAYHADPYVFETRWNVDSKSFWGSDAWERNYFGNNPDNPHRSEALGNVGRDIWHTANFVDYTAGFSATFAISGRKHPVKYRVANALFGCMIRSLFASVTYTALRG